MTNEPNDGAVKPRETLVLPPSPAAIAGYFQRRHSSIGEITEVNIAFNDQRWAEICGVPSIPRVEPLPEQVAA